VGFPILVDLALTDFVDINYLETQGWNFTTREQFIWSQQLRRKQIKRKQRAQHSCEQLQHGKYPETIAEAAGHSKGRTSWSAARQDVINFELDTPIVIEEDAVPESLPLACGQIQELHRTCPMCYSCSVDMVLYCGHSFCRPCFSTYLIQSAETIRLICLRFSVKCLVCWKEVDKDNKNIYLPNLTD
jgi:hypothetical protein